MSALTCCFIVCKIFLDPFAPRSTEVLGKSKGNPKGLTKSSDVVDDAVERMFEPLVEQQHPSYKNETRARDQ
ncbi:predicted protein [Sclerotinia sclerotiorum 1980 UF-70]|uniref:Uncharacterized protein n=1 Tax=Sclerotinia sclerotiorum (strain ATCC 18683 / 1980 / Ss-1) TaxID=665079 RepID=A7F076_SCLS1|nr:predicted protein [Sclerotinia sclerotiorum 1980 UF-70]EDN95118.1 predicted protein [Sclerotinia sclerotiorum 1980 UF-70]